MSSNVNSKFLDLKGKRIPEDRWNHFCWAVVQAQCQCQVSIASFRHLHVSLSSPLQVDLVLPPITHDRSIGLSLGCFPPRGAKDTS